MQKRKKLFYFELEPGMTIAQDVYSDENQLLIPCNTVLTKELISSLISHTVFEVQIFVDPPSEREFISTESYSQKIQASPEFQQFKNDYIENIDQTKEMLNDIVNKSEMVDCNAIIKSTVDIMAKNNSGFHIFDMLHNMRSYDDSTHIHSINVGLIAAIIGKWLRYSEDDINALILSGILHDLGKLTIPIEILQKPKSLTPEEYSVIKTHTINGYNLLKTQPIDVRAKEAALFHHERCDGSGYPFGIPGSRIPQFAKIIAIADVYDAMTANRVYRHGICPFDVIHMFEHEGLHNFDARTIIVFLENIVQTYINNTVRLNDGTVGQIIMINQNKLSRPVIKAGDKFIDLAKTPELKIEAII